jgi:hypothetical protein
MRIHREAINYSTWSAVFRCEHDIRRDHHAVAPNRSRVLKSGGFCDVRKERCKALKLLLVTYSWVRDCAVFPVSPVHNSKEGVFPASGRLSSRDEAPAILAQTPQCGPRRRCSRPWPNRRRSCSMSKDKSPHQRQQQQGVATRSTLEHHHRDERVCRGTAGTDMGREERRFRIHFASV